MNREGQSEPGRREAPRTSFWAGILVLALIGMTIFVVFKVVSSLIGV
jgi:hypothetical protein